MKDEITVTKEDFYKICEKVGGDYIGPYSWPTLGERLVYLFWRALSEDQKKKE